MATINAFTVMPMSQDFSLEAGKTYSGSITVSNPASATEDFYYQVEVTPYSVLGADYAADLVTISNRSEIIKWIKVEEPSGILKPNESKQITFTITVPATAPAGGQYATLAVSSANPFQADGGIAIQNVYEMASIIFAEVAGETVHDGEILENSVPGFSLTTPVQVSTTLVNNGNVHEAAEVYLKVRDVFANKVIYPEAGESGGILEMIMPETTRYLTQNVGGTAQLGFYEITQEVSYLGETSKVVQTVFICPLWFMILTILAVGGVIALILRRIFGRRRRSKFGV